MQNEGGELGYDLIILEKMIGALEPDLQKHFSEQFLKIKKSLFKFLTGLLVDQEKALRGLENVSVDTEYLIFDLEATRRERDKLKESLDGGSS